MKNNCGYNYGMRQPRMQNPDSCERMDRPRDYADRKNAFPVGMCYVPMQQWGNLFEADEGFAHGTMFQDLALSFTCTGCNKCSDWRQIRR